MADFGDNLSEPEVDPAAEFLAREQDQLAGLEDELKPAVTNEDPVIEETSTPPQTEEKVKPSSPDSQKATPQSTPVKHQPAREEPEKIKKWREEQKSRLEEKDANEEKKKAELREAAKKELEEWYKHHEELIAKTKADNRESALNAEKQFVAEADAIEPGTEWERIAKLCDFNPKSSRTSRDVSRMRSIILQLKQSPPNKSV
ncbi:clathrin light chain isoform X14 [Macrosteles quadrilineatus]|uniref:clathrin light chain isoform X14 n=1 Tax=Macrosteles quadrilineatus TaxID=74068 RepID=UPI0023E2A792|nr:clathrin light chain isoform X14 [Macrosteles quadrilineatus]